MPKLVFPVLADGLLVDVVIGVDGATTAALFSSGQPITAPVPARGAIDTGSFVTAVSTAILQRLGIPTQYRTTTRTASGILSVNVAKASVAVRDARDPTRQELVEPALSVMELTTPPAMVEVLIGLDFLLAANSCSMARPCSFRWSPEQGVIYHGERDRLWSMIYFLRSAVPS